ncbi:MAG: hypothetical protein CVV27_04560 [Candidatus Melainabacteria bacterium HGW-Melainabacteria-1]|nr:MAG: hypothetical protein CVV27_04560 [Candidatus Melainabacteria bacterium HGW-Melainabacteria-1]
MQYFFGLDQGAEPALAPNSEALTELTLAAAIERMTEVFRGALWDDPESDGLSTLQLKLVCHLGTQSDGSSLTQIAEVFGMAKSTLSVSLQALDKKQIIAKQVDAKDRRRSLIRLSPKGERLVERLGSFQDGVLSSIRLVPAKRRQQMLVGMLELLHHLQRAGLISLTGMCHDCFYLKEGGTELPYCQLLNRPLAETDIPLSWYQPRLGA